MNKLGKARRLLQVAPRRPREFAGRVAGKLEGAWDARTRVPSPLTPRPWREVMVELLPQIAPDANWAAIEAELELVDGDLTDRASRLPADQPMAFSQCAIGSLARSAYALCRLLKPAVVIETGVAYGMTSAYILNALAANAMGLLASIDLPPLGDEEGRYVGHLIDNSLRARWELHRGRSRQRLPALLRRFGSIDLFIHDSLHTSRTMSWEFNSAWAKLRGGGILLSDDIQSNGAFAGFTIKARPRFAAAVQDRGEGNQFGIALK